MMKKMEEMFVAWHVKFDSLSVSHKREEEGIGSTFRTRVGGISRGSGETELIHPRFVKLDVPRFNGIEDPTSWVCHVE